MGVIFGKGECEEANATRSEERGREREGEREIRETREAILAVTIQTGAQGCVVSLTSPPKYWEVVVVVVTPGSKDIWSPTAATRASWSTPGRKSRKLEGQQRLFFFSPATWFLTFAPVSLAIDTARENKRKDAPTATTMVLSPV
jgi:hypothetical protein